jgi:hypothetical protein
VHYITNEVLFKRKGDIRTTVKTLGVLARPNDRIYAIEGGNYFVISYYLNEDKAYVYGRKEDIPYYVGLAVIPDKKISEFIPPYPNKAFILKSDEEYDIISEH